MVKGPSSKSIFSQQLDRAVFVSYFLGAVVPLLAFGIAVQKYVLPTLDGDRILTIATIGIMAGVAALSLTVFLALRRLTHNAVTRMNEDNARLEAILAASQDLSTSLHGQSVAETAVACACQLVDARAVFLITRAAANKPLAPCASAGDDAESIDLAADSELLELAEESMSSRRPSSSQRAIAVPLGGAQGGVGGEERADGALLLLSRTPGHYSIGREQRDSLATLAALTSVALENANLQDAQRNFFAHTTDMLVMALDAHVDNRKGHANAVAQLANRLARVLELPPERMQNLHFAALLHDIGMLKIATSHHRSPSHFQKHPVIGHRMLSRIRLWEDVAPIVLHHHEWFDGAGYPEGLAGQSIPLEARIIAVADCFDASTRPEAHRAAFTVDEALGEVRKGAGSQFDPDVVVALAKLAERGELEIGPR